MENNNKKPTKSELERRIKNALVFVPKDKDYQSIYFADKGLKLEVTQEHTIISTTYHKHVFDNITSSGISKPYIYTRRFIEIALDTDCTYTDDNGYKFYSYQKMMNELKANKDKETEYNIAYYCDLWFFNLFNPLYSIDGNNASAFIVFLDYVCNVAKNSIIISEHTEDMTNKQFLDKYVDLIKELTADMHEGVIFEKKTDDELMQESIEALQEQEQEQQINQNTENNESQD